MSGQNGTDRGERLQIMLSSDELEAVDNFRFENRLPTRAAAVRELFRLGLTVVTNPETAANRMASKAYGVLRDVPVTDQKRKPPKQRELSKRRRKRQTATSPHQRGLGKRRIDVPRAKVNVDSITGSNSIGRRWLRDQLCSRLRGNRSLVMSTPEEYRRYARECMESAAKAKTDAERQTFLQMAHTWEQAALQSEGCTGSSFVPQPQTHS